MSKSHNETFLDADEKVGPKEIKKILARHERHDAQRLKRIHDSLTQKQSDFFKLVPFFLDVNYDSLPGFISEKAPSGLIAYEADRDTLLLAKKYNNSIKSHRRALRQPPLLGLYLMGSLGSLGQDRKSDFDIWLCHHKDLDAQQLQLLQNKATLLEESAKALGLQMHFFIMHAESFRDQKHLPISNESSGDTQHHLLLEEFYRSGLRMAGLPPLWWIVPPNKVQDYTTYCADLIKQRFIKPTLWLDFGGLSSISNGEFLSAGYWQLFKGIDAPYKSLLKLMLYESYAEQFPKIDWLSIETKILMFAEQEVDIAQLDPYYLMMQRIERYLFGSGQKSRLALVQRAFYFKTGVKLSTRKKSDWKHTQMQSCVAQWGWGKGELLLMDSRAKWKLPKVLDERNKLIAELSLSYRRLTDFARENKISDAPNQKDISLIGRKLHSALERRPGKVDLVNPDISKDISEEQVWVENKNDIWGLMLRPPSEKRERLKSTKNLVEMLLWLEKNKVIDKATNLNVTCVEQGPAEAEYSRVLKVLRKQKITNQNYGKNLEDYLVDPQAVLFLAFINVNFDNKNDSASHQVSDRHDPLCFSAQSRNLVHCIESVQLNTWGELEVQHYSGNEAILEWLCDYFNSTATTEGIEKLECHCFTSVHAVAINSRLSSLVKEIRAWFKKATSSDARFIFQVAEDYYLITQQGKRYDYIQLGSEAELHNYLFESVEVFRETKIDQFTLHKSPLASLMALNKPHRVQIFYAVKKNGIHFYILDDLGALYGQWLEGAHEQHFLIQQQCFFETLQRWRSLASSHMGSPLLEDAEFMKIEKQREKWFFETIKPPKAARKLFVELLMATGPRGPWRDGFSLICGSHEFNQLHHGDALYDHVAVYLQGIRCSNQSYPIYLTGVVTADRSNAMPTPVVELMKLKGAIEKRLAHAMAKLVNKLN